MILRAGRCGRTAPSSAPARSCCATSAAPTAIGCWSSISAATSICSPVPEPLLAPPAGCRGGWTGAARRRATAAGHAAGRPAFAPPRARRRAILLRSGAGPIDDDDRTMTTPDSSRIDRPAAGPLGGGRSAAAARVAGDQRARRLCVGHRRRRGDAPLSGAPGRVAARAARPAGDAEPPARAGAPAEHDVVWLGDEDAVAGPNTADRAGAPRRVQAGARPAGVALSNCRAP